MKNFKLKITPAKLLILIVIFGALLRFYSLNWGSPFYFHPDERNIAGSISRMYWEKTLNPHFFAYGSFWSYIILFLIKITDPLYQIASQPQIISFVENVLPKDPFARAIIFLRVFSALQGIGLITLSYFIGKTFASLSNSKFKIPASPAGGLNSKFLLLLLPFLVATSPGFIQASHFGTFEQSLAFLYALIFYLALKFFETRKFITWFSICVVFGISISIRVTSIILFPIIVGLLFVVVRVKNTPLRKLFSWVLYSLVLTIFSIVIFYLSNPYSFNLSFTSNFKFQISNLLSHEFLSTMKYESEVALGTMQVFYTGQFNQTVPIVYQFFRVLPFVLNPVIWILFILSLTIPLIVPLISFIACIPNKISTKTQAPSIPMILTLLFFGVTFLSGSLLFVKWTRYVIPSLPFIYVMIFLFLLKTLKLPLILFIALLSFVFSVFFTSIYSFDTRIEAARWAGENLNHDVKILSEVYDMGIVPFNEVFTYQNILLFNFYEMDDKFNDAANLAELKNLINQIDVIILPSRRIADTHLRLPNPYSNGNWFYENLFAGNLGFRHVQTFSHPYDKIIPGIAPDESFTVFDHPEVEIFIK
jgi:hypothetical protein